MQLEQRASLMRRGVGSRAAERSAVPVGEESEVADADEAGGNR